MGAMIRRADGVPLETADEQVSSEFRVLLRSSVLQVTTTTAQHT